MLVPDLLIFNFNPLEKIKLKQIRSNLGYDNEEDEDNPNLLGCVQTILTKASNSFCSTSNPESYSVRSYEPRKFVNLLLMSIHSKMSDSTKSFICRVYNLHVEIIK
jgi:hypothetical protein